MNVEVNVKFRKSEVRSSMLRHLMRQLPPNMKLKIKTSVAYTVYILNLNLLTSLRRSKSFKGFSQTGEDLLIAKFFPESDTGFYLDVGSGNPVIGSNTYFFYRQGWRGILIDQIPGMCE